MSKTIIFFLSVGVITFTQNSFAKQRVVSLVPSTTEIIEKLKMDSLLVGVSKFCSASLKTCKLPSAGTAIKIDWERLLLLKPDLVFVDSSTKKSDLDNLETLNIPYVTFAHKRLHDIKKSILIVGENLNVAEEAKLVLNKFNQELLSLKNKMKNKNVLLVLSVKIQQGFISSAFVVGNNTFYSDIVDLLGAKMVTSFSDYRAVGPETLIKYKPDRIIMLKQNIQNRKNIIKAWLKYYPNAQVSVSIDKAALIPSVNIIKFIKEISF